MNRIIALLLFVIPIGAYGQNIQLHYDMDSERNYFTVTHEMYKPDNNGYTFWFIDMDFNFPGNTRSMSSAYWEISRGFFIPGLKEFPAFKQTAVHIEYNDGFGVAGDSSGITYGSVFLAGITHSFIAGNFSLTPQVFYRIPISYTSNGVQFTFVWSWSLFNNKLLLTGYSDLWTQDKQNGYDSKEWVFQSEPQIWYSINHKLAVGGELEISRNFPVGPAGWNYSPTVAIKWDF